MDPSIFQALGFDPVLSRQLASAASNQFRPSPLMLDWEPGVAAGFGDQGLAERLRQEQAQEQALMTESWLDQHAEGGGGGSEPSSMGTIGSG